MASKLACTYDFQKLIHSVRSVFLPPLLHTFFIHHSISHSIHHSITRSICPFTISLIITTPSHSSPPHHLTHHHHTISLITTTPSHSPPPPQHHSFHLSRIQTCLSCLLPPSTDPSVLHTSSLLCQRDFVLKLRQWFLQNASLGKLFFPSFHFFSLSLFLSFKSMNAAILFMILLHRIFLIIFIH